MKSNHLKNTSSAEITLPSIDATVSTSIDTTLNPNLSKLKDYAKIDYGFLTPDEFGIFSFTSRRRDWVRINAIKEFAEDWSPLCQKRIQALRPGYYTRLGAAIRHTGKLLADRPHQNRLMLVITDGKPNDVDHYEGRYGIEDSRRAVRECRRNGLALFGVTVDRKAQDYFPYIFGAAGHAIVGTLENLPAALPRIYRQLVQ